VSDVPVPTVPVPDPVVPVLMSSEVLLSVVPSVVVPVLEVVLDVGAQAYIHPVTSIAKNNFFITLI
jgi:hypothetical protein